MRSVVARRHGWIADASRHCDHARDCCAVDAPTDGRLKGHHVGGCAARSRRGLRTPEGGGLCLRPERETRRVHGAVWHGWARLRIVRLCVRVDGGRYSESGHAMKPKRAVWGLRSARGTIGREARIVPGVVPRCLHWGGGASEERPCKGRCDPVHGRFSPRGWPVVGHGCRASLHDLMVSIDHAAHGTTREAP